MSMKRQLALARYGLLEGRRSGLPLLLLAGMLVVIGLGAFLGAATLNEAERFRSAIGAAIIRLGSALVVMLHVAASVARQDVERSLELLLAQPIGRTAYYVGRFAGFALLALATAALASVPLALLGAGPGLAAWSFSLALELCLCAALAFFFSSSRLSAVGAMAASIGFYILSRSMNAILSIADNPFLDSAMTGGPGRAALEALAFVLPALGEATRAEWIVDAAPDWTTLGWSLAGLAAYTFLLVAAGLLDFHRRDI